MIDLFRRLFGMPPRPQADIRESYEFKPVEMTSLRPGDILFVRAKGRIPLETLKRIREQMQPYAPDGVSVLVVDEQINLSVYRRETHDGWVAANSAGDRFRTWGDSGPEWTSDPGKALRLARREDAEAMFREDEDVWRIIPASPALSGDRSAEGAMK